MSLVIAIIAFIIIFSILILVHEFGHFASAKLFGVGVKEFGLGMPPVICKVFRALNTDFTLNWIPFGGFVRLKGQDDFDSSTALKEKDDVDSFERARLIHRIIIICGGVIMNFVLALVLLFLTFKISFTPLAILPDSQINFNSFIIMKESFARQNGFLVANPNVPQSGILVNNVAENSISISAGILKGDIIKSVNGKQVSDIREFFDVIYSTTSLNLGILRNNESITININKSDPAEKLGIYLESKEVFQPRTFTFTESVRNTFYEFTVQAKVTLYLFGQMIKNLFITGQLSKDVAGPVGIAQLTYSFSQEGFWALALFTATLSMSLGVINIIPIPALDGGRLLFMLIEGIFRKPIAKHIEEMIHKFGFFLLMGLILLITWNDILRIFR